MSASTYELTINQQPVTVTVAGDTPLLWVLRDHLNMTGTKFGCGFAQCGACTVIIDGNSTRSCMMPIQFVAGKNVDTIEGIPPEHPIKQAWIDIQVPQCGYCQSGQMMSAYDLLNKNPNASEQEIKDFMAGNICRCGTYPKILKAIKQVQADMQAGTAASGVQQFDPAADNTAASGDAS